MPRPGNLAGSVAANAAAAGLEAYVLIPDGLEQGKVLGATIYGARVIAVHGNYDHVNRLCSQIAFRFGWGFVNVNLRPFYAEGSKSMGFEIAEDLGWRAPDHVVAPMAGGSLIGKIHKAFHEFEQLGLLDGPVRTRMFGAQATGCNPISATVKTGREQGAADPQPRHDRQEPGDRRPCRRLLRLEADPRDRRLERGRGRRGHRRGHDAAGRDRGDLGRDRRRRHPGRGPKLIEQGKIDRDGSTVLCITGNGLKTQEALIDRLARPVVIEPTLEAFEAVVGSDAAFEPGRRAAGVLVGSRRVSGRIGRPPSISCSRAQAGSRWRLHAMAVVRIPTPLRPHAGGQDRVEAAGATVGEILASLGRHFPPSASGSSTARSCGDS